MIYHKHPIRSLLTLMLRNRTLFPSNSIKGSNYREFLKDKNELLRTRLYKYAPNLESLLTQQYVCVMCTLWSDNTCAFTRFHSVKNANTQLIWSSGCQFGAKFKLLFCAKYDRGLDLGFWEILKPLKWTNITSFFLIWLKRSTKIFISMWI
jgi:hypothetical protein